MKIGIDARNYFSSNKSGVDYYVKSLVDGIIKYDKKNIFYFFVDSRYKKKYFPRKLKNITFIKIPFNKKYLKAIDLVAKLLKLDFIHYTSGGIPQNYHVPYIMTVHDLTFEIHPEFYDPIDYAKQKKTKIHAKNALGIIAISNSTKDDLVKKYHIPSGKIIVSHLAFNKSEVAAVKPITKNYLLFVGNLQPRKNLMRVLDAIKNMDPAKRPNLVVVGNLQDSSEFSKINKFIDENRLENNILLKGYVGEKELDILFSECLAVIYPSIYEGFGYNILEAFYYRKPLITSNVSSMPEIAKDAAVYVSPFSTKSIKDAIDRVINDKANNSKIVRKGLHILKQYSTKNMIKSTLNAYEKFNGK